ncbi:GNAT family N-acetyltransferase [Dyadobacter pollutisoli]
MHGLLRNCFEAAAFHRSETFTSHFIPVDSNEFARKICPAERRRLNKCIRTGYSVHSGKCLNLDEAYRFLIHCREQAGYTLPLSLCQMRELAGLFPERMLLFSVFDNAALIALSVTIKVTDDTLYNFLMADLIEYRKYSPVVLLIETIYNFCQRTGVRIIDLGISLDKNGDPKPTLSRFKKNIGGQECEKISYQLRL